MKALLDSQQRGIDKLHKYKVGALFMEPGTGKTRTAAELVQSVPDFDYVLWLTPFQTKANLQAELDKWGITGIRIEGIESLSNSDRLYLNLINELESSENPFVVVDESLKIKNWDAKRTTRIVELGKLARYKLILNGTPISRNIVDVWAQMEFLSPKILNMGLAEFKNTFCEYTKITKRVNKTIHTREWISKYHNIDYLYSLITHYIYECDLNLELKRQHIDINYTVDDDTREQYNNLKELYLDNEMLQWKNNNIFLEMTQKMQHTYCCTDDKFKQLQAIMQANDNSRIIVYAKYIRSQESLKERYPQLKIMSYGKHSYGLNLQKYNITVFWDKTWDYAQKLQVMARTMRTGQTETCYYYDFTGDVGLERLIDKNIEKKTNLLTYFKTLGHEQLKKEL